MNKYRIKIKTNNKFYYIQHVEVVKNDPLTTRFIWTPNEEDAHLFPKEVADPTNILLLRKGYLSEINLA